MYLIRSSAYNKNMTKFQNMVKKWLHFQPKTCKFCLNFKYAKLRNVVIFFACALVSLRELCNTSTAGLR